MTDQLPPHRVVNGQIVLLTAEEIAELEAQWANPPPPPVPATVSQAQLRIALHRAGLLAQVQAAVDAAGDPELAIRWAAPTYERASPYLNTMAEQLGITEAQRDDLFRLAATL